MAQTITITATNPITENERRKALQYMQDTLTDTELDKLYLLAQSKKARQALQHNWSTITQIIM